jgi:hypothetical protein
MEVFKTPSATRPWYRRNPPIAVALLIVGGAVVARDMGPWRRKIHTIEDAHAIEAAAAREVRINAIIAMQRDLTTSVQRLQELATDPDELVAKQARLALLWLDKLRK